jgi:hypothetical protein
MRSPSAIPCVVTPGNPRHNVGRWAGALCCKN